MNREEAHKLIDQIFDSVDTEQKANSEETKQELPKDKRVVRTKTSGDRVYLIDEIKKIRHWVSNPDVLKKLGFELTDVVEVEDSELLRYQMGPVLYKVED